MFDRSTRFIEHLQYFLLLAKRGNSWLIRAIHLLFDIFSTEHSAYVYTGRAARPATSECPSMTASVPENSNEPSKILLTRKQAAAALSVGERTLWAMTWPRGPIRSVRIGRSVRYSADALRTWVESQQEVSDR